MNSRKESSEPHSPLLQRSALSIWDSVLGARQQAALGSSAMYGRSPLLSTHANTVSSNPTAVPHMGDRLQGQNSETVPAPTNGDNHSEEIFSRKVFIGGVPSDVAQETIVAMFSKFGPVFVDWPVISNNAGTLGGSTRAGKCQTGYLFVVYEEERSVQMLMRSCYEHEGKTYLLISSPTIKHKPVEVRPWRLSDINFMLRADMPINHRRTVFIGAMPRPITAGEVARHMNDFYGPVCYAGILVDPELQYPKGAARVTFATEKGFLNALNAKFMLLPHDGARKRVEIKPYIMEDSACDECGATQSDGSLAVHFCLDRSCAQYFCEQCWSQYHSADVRLLSHRPFSRKGQLTWLMPSSSTTTEADGVPDNCEEPMAF